MARAKRTARAEARRRHRAEQGIVDGSVGELDTDDAAPAAEGRDRSRASSSGQPERIGVGAAFRQAFRPLDARGDLAALPAIAFRTKALWVPILLTIVSAAVFVTIDPGNPPADTLGVVAYFFMSYFLQTPAIGGVFIAGFLAPRASWLLGIIVGLVSAVGYSAIVLGGYLVPAGNQADLNDVVVASFILSPIMGAIFASAAAWYRRFLKLSNPNRGRRATANRTDGRSRNRNGDQKAGARR